MIHGAISSFVITGLFKRGKANDRRQSFSNTGNAWKCQLRQYTWFVFADPGPNLRQLFFIVQRFPFGSIRLTGRVKSAGRQVSSRNA
jgi:hypothetical protein